MYINIHYAFVCVCVYVCVCGTLSLSLTLSHSLACIYRVYTRVTYYSRAAYDLRSKGFLTPSVILYNYEYRLLSIRIDNKEKWRQRTCHSNTTFERKEFDGMNYSTEERIA